MMPVMPRRVQRRTSRRTPGRPTRCVPEVTGKIIKAVRRGAHLEAAAYAAGVHPSTVYRWLADGQQDDTTPAGPADDTKRAFREFSEALTRARAKAELDMVAAVVEDAKGGAVVKKLTRTWRNGTVEEEVTYAPPNGRVALAYLERVHPARWGRQPLEITGEDGGPIQVESRHVIIGALAERVHTLLQGQLEPGGDADDGDGPAAVAS